MILLQKDMTKIKNFYKILIFKKIKSKISKISKKFQNTEYLKE